MVSVFMIIAIVICISMSLTSVSAFQATQGPTEVIQYNPFKAYNGYTLFRGQGGLEIKHGTAWLIDMEGQVVHSWPDVVTNPQLWPNGHLTHATTGYWRGEEDPDGSWIRELDWEGKIVRKWKPPADRPDLNGFHHDHKLIFNKKLNKQAMLALCYFRYPLKDVIVNGGDPSVFKSDQSAGGIVEMDMDGNIIWEWHLTDHLIQDFDATKNNYVGKGKTIADYPGKLDTNWGGRLQNANGLDYNEKLDQILWDSKNNSEIWIIDHGRTFIPNDPKGSRAKAAGEAGDILYRWGNPSVYGAGDGPWYKYGKYGNGHQQLFNIHNGQWIDEGLPGAGNIIVFDNGYDRTGETYSTIVEFNPYDGPMENGVYVPQMKAGYEKNGLSKQIVWRWNEKLYHRFARGLFSFHISGMERQPNCNTLICAGEDGHLVEVTYGDPEKGELPEIVWEYINPDTDTHGVVKHLRMDMYNQVYRAHRYGPDYPGLKGKDLTRKGTITEIAAVGAQKITQQKI